MFHRTAVMLTAAAFTAVLELGAAEPAAAPAAPGKVYFETDFSQAKLPWGKAGAGIIAVEPTAGPAEGNKALKLHFKFDAPGAGWPQSQHYLQEPFTPEGDFVVEFDLKIERPGNDVGLRLELVPFNCYTSKTKLPFIDDGAWKKVRLIFKARPGKEGTKIERLCFTANGALQKAGDETVYSIANLKIYAAK